MSGSAQRAEAASGGGVNLIQPKAAQLVQQYVVNPRSPDGERTPTITPGAVRGGPAPILGTYSVSMRPLEVEGWSGVTQQIAHTYPTDVDDVYDEDATRMCWCGGRT